MDLTGKHYTWVQNRACEYFPCHNGADEETFNCLFCYCPLYHLPDCGGDYTIKNGVKNCTTCLRPHQGADSYRRITAKLRKSDPISKP